MLILNCAECKNDFSFDCKYNKKKKYCSYKCQRKFHSRIWRNGKGKEYNKKWHEKNPEYQTTKNKERWNINKMKCLNHYSNNDIKCACCGERYIEFMVMDHIEGGGRKHIKSIGNKRLYDWIIENSFPPMFRVLCDNCNASFGRYGYCPHQNENKD